MVFKLNEDDIQKMAEAREKSRHELALSFATVADENIYTRARDHGLNPTDYPSLAAVIEAIVDRALPDMLASPTSEPIWGPFKNNPAPSQGQTVNIDPSQGQTFNIDLQPEPNVSSLRDYMVGTSQVPDGQHFFRSDRPNIVGGVDAKDVLTGSKPDLYKDRFWVAYYAGETRQPEQLKVRSIETRHGYDPDSRVASRVVVVDLPQEYIHEDYLREVIDAIERAAVSGEQPGEDILDIVHGVRVAQNWTEPEPTADQQPVDEPVQPAATSQWRQVGEGHWVPDTETGQGALPGAGPEDTQSIAVLGEQANQDVNRRFREVGEGTAFETEVQSRQDERSEVYRSTTYGNQGNQS